MDVDVALNLNVDDWAVDWVTFMRLNTRTLREYYIRVPFSFVCCHHTHTHIEMLTHTTHTLINI